MSREAGEDSIIRLLGEQLQALERIAGSLERIEERLGFLQFAEDGTLKVTPVERNAP